MSTDVKSCPRCRASFVAAAEERAGYCLGCFPAIAREMEEANGLVTRLDGRVDELRRERDEVTAKHAALAALLQAERDGSEAEARGATDHDNPHQPGSDRHLAWENGFLQNQIARRWAEAQALLGWTLEHLTVVRELAKGNGQDELASKLDVIFEKVGPHIFRLVD